jgi:4-hydroxy-4-methyl-2-oxoglutarate aldolase
VLLNIDVIRDLARRVDTTAICDTNKTIRVMSAGIKCRSNNPYACGLAYTVRCRGDFFPVARAIESASAGDVIIVDGGGHEIALAGELFARAGKVRQLAAIIVDGGYRDLGYVSSCDLPVYSRHLTPMAGSTMQLGELQVPVACGGAVVLPGDVIVADREGIAVLDPLSAEATLKAALEVKTIEARAIQQLEKGSTLVDVLNIDEHAAHLYRGEPSRLQFTV